MYIIVLIIALLLVSGTARAFDCVGVRLPSTIVICSSRQLMRLADERQAAINNSRARIGEERWPALWEDQKAWVRSYATACGVPPERPPPQPVPGSVIACFEQAGVARTAYLRGYGLAAGSAAAPSSSGFAGGRIGPSFDCGKASSALPLLICAGPRAFLSRSSLQSGVLGALPAGRAGRAARAEGAGPRLYQKGAGGLPDNDFWPVDTAGAAVAELRIGGLREDARGMARPPERPGA